MEDIEKMKEELKQRLSEKRYIHSIGVMEMAEELAKIYGVDENEARVAGLLHDIAKEIPEDEKLKYIEKNGIEIDEIERKSSTIFQLSSLSESFYQIT